MAQKFNQPVSGLVTPRFGGIATFMRLPHVPLDEANGIDIGLVGIPWDGGTTNRPGPRHGPRQMRDVSSMVRKMHQTSHIIPYDIANCADLGDCPVNPANVDDGLKRVETYFKKLVGKGIRPLSAGGDHLCTLPILRAVGEKKPVGMIHFDAHTDLYDGYFGGFKYTHGTPFRRAIEEGVLDPKRTMQIGLRGSMYDLDDFDFGEKMGVRLMRIEEAMEKGAGEGHGGGAQGGRQWPDLCELRYRHARSRLCAGHRHAGNRRLHHLPGAADAARPSRPQHRRRRCRRSFAALRSLRD